MRLPVLHLTDRFVVFAKPSGLAVHRGAEVRDRDVVLTVGRDQLGRWLYPVHRLDRPVSGCLLFALDPDAARELQAAMAAARKTYVALCRGHYRGESPVQVHNPMKDDNGVLKEARSEVEHLAGTDEPRCSFFVVRPQTGRYHQVRRHLRDLHHPVLGDPVHGDTRINRWWRETHGLPRLTLHCLALSLTLPDGSALDVRCGLPEDLAAFFARLPAWDAAKARCPDLGLPPPSTRDT